MDRQLVNLVWYFIRDIQRAHLCKVWMHSGMVYERWTHTQLARAVHKEKFCEIDAVWLSMEGEGTPDQLGRLPLLPTP